jgi:hypothetical protein
MTGIAFKELVHTAEQPVQAGPEPEKARAARMLRQREIIWAARHGLPAPPLSAECSFPSPASYSEWEWEKARAARLMQQRAIIKARLQERRAASQGGPLPMGQRKEFAKAA